MNDPQQTDLPSQILSSGNAVPIGLISNPNSGRNRKHIDAVSSILSDYPHIHHELTLQAEQTPTALETLASKSVKIVAINGGDGTAARVLAHLLQDSPFTETPMIVLLPGGTTNMNAGDVGLRGSLLSATRRLCRWSVDRNKDGRVLQRAILRVVPGEGQSAIYGMFFGTGAVIQGIEYCRASVHSHGVKSEIGPGLAMVRTLWGLVRQDPRFSRPVAAAISLGDQPSLPEEDMLVLLISSLERLFLGMRPFWGTEDAPLHISLVSHGAERFLRNLPSLLRGHPGRHMTPATGYRSHNVENIGLLMDGTYTVDGEMYAASRANGPVTITNGGIVSFVRI